MKTLILSAIATIFALSVSAQPAAKTATGTVPANKKEATVKPMDKQRPAMVVTSDTPSSVATPATEDVTAPKRNIAKDDASGISVAPTGKTATSGSSKTTEMAPASESPATAPIVKTVRPAISKPATATTPKN